MTGSPGPAAANALQAIACMVVATLCMATMNAIVRHLSPSMHTLEIVFFRNAYMTVLMTPLAFIPALYVWQIPTPTQWALLVATGVLGAGGQLLLAQALRVGEVSVVMPFDFLRLFWVSIIAYVAFAEVPDVWSWIGGTIIFVSSIYLVLRERQISRGKPIDPPA